MQRRLILAVSAALCALAIPTTAQASRGYHHRESRLPGVPQNVRVIEVTDTTITLAWDRDDGSTSYDVRVDGGWLDQTPTAYYEFDTLADEETPLSPCTSYVLGVRGRNTRGRSEWIDVTATTTGCSA